MQRMRGFRGGDLAEFSLRRVYQLGKKPSTEVSTHN